MNNRKIFAAVALILAVSLFVPVQGTVARVFAEEQEEPDISGQMDFLELLIEFVEANYVDEMDVQELINGAYKGVFDALDQHSVYYTEEEYDDFATNINGTYEGVGIHITIRDGLVTVVSPIEGTPADKAGLKPGDKIIYVDDVDISEYNLDGAAMLIRGEPGTEVVLGIKREGQQGILYFSMVRETIELNSVKGETVEGDIGYIRITDFNEHVSENVEQVLDRFDGEGIESVIIDLRNNPGGILGEVVEISEYFIPEGPVVHVDSRNGGRKTYTSQLKQPVYNIAVLVNGGSASASEIFAGAVQDTGAGVLIGTQTFGKGTVQSVLPLRNGGYLKMTTAKYLTPDEREIDGTGLTPDIVVESVYPEDKYKDELSPVKGDRKPSVGTVGLDVLGAEQRLDIMGYKVGAVDGVFDLPLAEAVEKFQADNSIYPYGVLDFTTQERLQQKFDLYILEEDVDEQLQKAVEVLKNGQK